MLSPNFAFEADAVRQRTVSLSCPCLARLDAALGVMKRSLLLFSLMLATALGANAAEFRDARLADQGTTLTITPPDGQEFSAPKFEGQDSFESPAVSADRRFVGWLALFPNKGASYSQPLSLVVMDTSKRTRRFAGDFGMVFGWCFATRHEAVVYRFQFPHGMSPIGFQMRRIADGKLLRHALIDPIVPNDGELRAVRVKAPAWTRCAQEDATAE